MQISDGGGAGVAATLPTPASGPTGGDDPGSSAAASASPAAATAPTNDTPSTPASTPTSDNYTPTGEEDDSGGGSTPNLGSWLNQGVSSAVNAVTTAEQPTVGQMGGDGATGGTPAASGSASGSGAGVRAQSTGSASGSGSGASAQASAQQSAIDKQNQQLSQFPSSQNADGTISYTLPDGNTITVDPQSGASTSQTPMGNTINSVINQNGSTTQTDSDGARTTFNTNGDTTTVHPGVSTTYTSHDTGETTTSYEDGTTIVRHADGSTTTTSPDGNVENTVHNANGSVTSKDSDGSVTTVDPNGVQTVVKPGGYSTQTYPNGFKMSQFPDGTQMLEAPNGDRQVTNPDGSTHVEYGTRLASRVVSQLPDQVQSQFQQWQQLHPDAANQALARYQGELQDPSKTPQQATQDFLKSVGSAYRDFSGGGESFSFFDTPGKPIRDMLQQAGAPGWLQTIAGGTADLGFGAALTMGTSIAADGIDAGDLALTTLTGGAGSIAASKTAQALGAPQPVQDLAGLLGGVAGGYGAAAMSGAGAAEDGAIGAELPGGGTEVPTPQLDAPGVIDLMQNPDGSWSLPAEEAGGAGSSPAPVSTAPAATGGLPSDLPALPPGASEPLGIPMDDGAGALVSPTAAAGAPVGPTAEPGASVPIDDGAVVPVPVDDGAGAPVPLDAGAGAPGPVDDGAGVPVPVDDGAGASGQPGEVVGYGFPGGDPAQTGAQFYAAPWRTAAAEPVDPFVAAQKIVQSAGKNDLFHATNSAALPGIEQAGGLVPAAELGNHGLTRLSGEGDAFSGRAAPKTFISAGQGPSGLGTALAYADQALAEPYNLSGLTDAQIQSRIDDLHQILSQDLTDAPKGIGNVVDRPHLESYLRQLETEQALRQSMPEVPGKFPVLFHMNGEGLPVQSITNLPGEVTVNSSVPFSTNLKSAFAPTTKLSELSAWVERVLGPDNGVQVLPLESLGQAAGASAKAQEARDFVNGNLVSLNEYVQFMLGYLKTHLFGESR